MFQSAVESVKKSNEENPNIFSTIINTIDSRCLTGSCAPANNNSSETEPATARMNKK